jgi:hypothetical protein
VWITLIKLLYTPLQYHRPGPSIPEREEKVWFDKVAEVNQIRRGYQEQAAKGYITFDELGAALSKLEETCKSAERELWSVRNRLERVEQLVRDKDALREDYFGIAPDALDSLTPEEWHDFYKLVRLRVVIYPNCDLEISWAGGEGIIFSTSESVSPWKGKHDGECTYVGEG